TGANKGLGLSLVRALCREWGQEARIYLMARDEAKGLEARRQLEREGLRPLFCHLDLTDQKSIEAAAQRIGAEQGGLDLLVQNGAYAALPDRPSKEQVRVMIQTNNHGTHRVLRAFRSLLLPGSRVLVVASGFGTLKSLDPSLHARFDTERSDFDQLERVLDDYVKAVESDRASSEKWPDWINIASKVGQVAAMRIFARQLATDPATPPGILVNAVCPGWLITDASRPYLKDLPPDVKPKMPDDAVHDVLWAGLLPSGTTEPYGELVQYRRVLPWN
ncbi:MAG TPA: SDR family NAD(P)-dependent oxidoreductase, partial [Polyangiaceae bacterium]|nr:SDR family NAD(P)-dependent oxidoreductase [Polyangiaceae bacterium]